MKKSWRKIVVNNIEYVWCLPGNGLSDNHGHIIVHINGASNSQVLYLDTIVWSLEIRPKMVREAIIFALNNSWQPSQKGNGLYLGYIDNKFIVLPTNIHFTHELKKH